MDIISVIINLFLIWYLAYAIHVIRKVFMYAALWQLKEYRRDRIIAFFRTQEARKIMFAPSLILKGILFVLFVFLSTELVKKLPFYFEIFSFTAIVFGIMYTFLGTRDFFTGLMKKWKRPKLTKKSIALITASSGVILSLFLFIYKNESINIYLGLLGVDLLVACIVSGGVVCLKAPTEIAKKRVVIKASKKITSIKGLKVVGITGSVGKTSTKEFLAEILEAKYRVAKTPESINTKTGIAKYIVNQLPEDAEIFIVEMGAYKKGEIKEICEIVKPKIGVITYIGNQHLELFGSIQNLTDAKYELIESLPTEGKAFFNEDNEYCRKMAQKAKEEGREVEMYGLKNTKIEVLQDQLEIQYKRKEKQITLTPKILGNQAAINIIGAVEIAIYLKVSLQQIQDKVSKISPPAHTMEIVGKFKEATLIDDTFNASRESTIAAFEYMKIYKGKKRLVLSPLIELGTDAKAANRKITEIAKDLDVEIIKTANSNMLAFKKQIEDTIGSEDIIVFEGKEAKKFLQVLQK